MKTEYDQSYFDKWYRDPVHRVSSRASARRKAALALAVAEYYLERPVRTVLDIGCGEGHWQPILTGWRPKLRYTGVDSSEYAVQRFGRRRQLRLGGFSNLGDLGLATSYDLIVCSDTLYYVSRQELELGFGELVDRLAGVAFLEAYASDTALTGDFENLDPRGEKFYRKLFRRHGLVSCGSHCYLASHLAGLLTPLERGSNRS